MQIIVLGMHRSGTSALTGLLSLMGAYVGAPDELLLPDEDNPKGFFERRDVVALNRELMGACGCSWHQVYRWNAGHPPSTQLVLRLRKVVDQLSMQPLSAIKDPRFCLTLPHWLSQINKPVILLCSRDPRVIVHSLATRNAMPPDYALALWEYYSVFALRNVAQFHRSLAGVHAIAYESLIENPLALTTQLKQRIPALHLPTSESIQAHVSIDLNRSLSFPGMTLSAQQQELYAMWRGEIPLNQSLHVSGASLAILRDQEQAISGAPVQSRD